MSVRLLVVWCPDWPVVAAARSVQPAGLTAREPMAVVAANRVVACSAVARTEGVKRGMRRREAQARCPELRVLSDDPVRDARLFEPVAAAVEELAVGVEVVRPGVVAVPARGPVGYFGGPEAAAERLVDRVADRAGVECQVGIADGLFAATLAARRGLLIPPGDTPGFLDPLGIHELNDPHGPDRTDLVDLLRRLGLRTLGAFAAVPERDVASRFGAAAVLAHRLARGLEERPPARRRPPPELDVTEILDPPVDRVDAAAFVARTLAERLHAGLAAHGLACTRLGILASTERGEELARVWRCAEPLTPPGIADRVRWQLDGWLRRETCLQGRAIDAVDRPSSGVTALRLDPVEVVEGHALQLDLWRGDGHAESAERAGRALVHVQGLLGQDGVVTPVLGGGRGLTDRVRLVPWGDERTPRADPDAPWPGRLPVPSPTLVPTRPITAAVLDERGAGVAVTARFELTGRPHRVALAGRPGEVHGWAGPWPADERWWAPESASRCARLQVLTEDSAYLLVWEHDRWTVAGVYD
jgi:protein ImuB